MSIRRAAFYIEKGGVGKTTSTAHIGTSACRHHDMDTVLLDLAGTQNDLTTQFGLSETIDEPDAPISAVFGDEWEFIRDNIDNVVDRMIYETDEGPDLIPADSGLSGADNNLASIPVEERYLKLNEFITNELAERYDLALLDLPGKEDNITLNGIVAAEYLVTPVCPGEFERSQLDRLRDDLVDVRGDLEDVLDEQGIPYPTLSMVIPTKIDKTTNQSEQFVNDVTEGYDEIVVEPVADSQNVGNLQGEGGTLFSVEKDELYTTGQRARDAYRTNTTTLLNQTTPR